MPHGCWIDLFGAPDPSGDRRRVFGPATLDAFVWRRYADGERILIVAGPSARVRITLLDGDERLLAPRETCAALAANAIASLAIERATSPPKPAAQDARGRPIVQRDVADPPRPPRRRRDTAREADAPR